jgi:hypothetical protein
VDPIVSPGQAFGKLITEPQPSHLDGRKINLTLLLYQVQQDLSVKVGDAEAFKG